MRWAAYAHPLVGGLVLGLLFFVGSLGLRSRSWPKARAVYLRRHALLGPWVCVAVLSAHVSGLGAVWWARDDLVVASSGHFRTGSVLVLLLLLLFMSQPFMHRAEVRQLHPWIGALALLVAGAHVFFGLQLTR
ncbi:MAG: DUF4079 family protein [Candidatus Binatia bacterium]|nr:DUF4079 family protein [Candidatus Binatia bacterium]